jgi:hypothetical protein
MTDVLPKSLDSQQAATEAAMPNDSFRRTRRRYLTLVVLVALLLGGWSAFWYYAAGEAQVVLDGWRDREAKAGRIYSCGEEAIGGFPFRIEVACTKAAARFNAIQPPLDIKTAGILAAVQIYQPDLVISEFTGPATIGNAGQPAVLSANWSLAQSSLRGMPAAPERVSIVVDNPVLERLAGGTRDSVLRANRIELHGRIAEGSAADRPVIEAVFRAQGITAPSVHAAVAQPLDADITAMLRGLNDFAPKPWAVRFREIQAAGGSIDITRARIEQGAILAIGSGSLALDPQGYLTGQLRVTIAGVEEFLDKIGAQRLVQHSPTMDRLAGFLDRFSPGLGNAARQQAGANISAGLNMLGEQTTLEGRRAVTLPLRFDDGAVFLGPIPIGHTAALF